ncbi:MAG: hypothetical protein LUO94_11755 [Methylococcaceae bacterium]|jgi:transposase|nr:hypothetical protein [Methylococcaceae bacterium]
MPRKVISKSFVCAIDAYVDSLDLAKQGFQKTSGGICAGQPAYLPEALLKLYLYGLHQQSP